MLMAEILIYTFGNYIVSRNRKMPASTHLKNGQPLEAGGLNVEYRNDLRAGIGIAIFRSEGCEAITGFVAQAGDGDHEPSARLAWILSDLCIRDRPDPFIIPRVARADWQIKAVAALLADHFPPSPCDECDALGCHPCAHCEYAKSLEA